MLIKNPIIKDWLLVLGTWYVLLFVFIGPALSPPVMPWRLPAWAITSLLVAAIGFAAGLAFTLIAHAIQRGAHGAHISQGSQIWGASISMGGPPALLTPPRSSVLNSMLESRAWWPALRARAPLHAEAVRAVFETMAAMPRMPASSVPGGHGGRSLIEHSLAVADHMLVTARTWVYEGQRDKRGRIRVPLADPNRPHRFEAKDVPLLLLAGLAHDLGKLLAYAPIPGQETQAVSGPLLRVTEVRHTHDTEGARLLRQIPEVMALPIHDRNALIAAVGHYHHPFGLPNAAWVDDRIRSLTELLAHTDIEVGRMEGHTLLSPSDDDEVDDDEAPAPTITSATLAAVAGLSEEELADAELDSLAKLASRVTAPASERVAPKPAAPAAQADESMPRELALFMQELRRPGAINGKQRASRVAWKYGPYLYVMDAVMRAMVRNRCGDPIWAGEATADRNGNMSPFTQAVAEQLHQRGALVTEWKGMTFSPSRALFRMKTSGAAVAVLIVRVEAVPGANTIRDAESPIEILGPFWGAASAKDKKGKEESRPTDGKIATTQTGVPLESFVASAPPPAGPAATLDDADLPFPLPPAPAQDAGSTPPPAPTEAGANVNADAVLRDLTEVVASEAFRQKHTHSIMQRERADGRYLVIPLGGDAGRAVTCVIEDLRASGYDVSGVRVATLAETGEPAYVFRLP